MASLQFIVVAGGRYAPVVDDYMALAMLLLPPSYFLEMMAPTPHRTFDPTGTTLLTAGTMHTLMGSNGSDAIIPFVWIRTRARSTLSLISKEFENF